MSKHSNSFLTPTRRRLFAFAGVGVVLFAAGLVAPPLLGPSPAAAQDPTGSVSQEELLKTGTIEDRILGSEDAPVTIIEYASFTCPHCADFHEAVWPELKEKYIDTGKVRFIFRDFPLDDYAAAVSMLTRCVAEDKFYPFVKVLFAQQNDWARVPANKRVETLLKYAKQAGFTQEEFTTCLRNQKLLDGINWVRSRANKEFGVSSTPTFFVNGEMLRGGHTLESFEEMIEPHLNS